MHAPRHVSLKVPFVDLKAQYEAHRDELDQALRRVVASTGFIGGEECKRFEEEFAGHSSHGSAAALHCAGCGNGTDALYLVLRALGIGAGDEVITVAHTFIATSEAISRTGAKPVFIDVEPDTLLMDPARIEAAVTPRTKAVIPVHLYGQLCDMDRIADVAARHRLKVVEDCAQSHGARWRGQRSGARSAAACFSFYPGKNLGAYGDAGAVVSTDAELVAQVRMLANHGRLEKYLHAVEGVNSRLDALQAAVLRAKLAHLNAWNARRRAHAALYGQKLAGSAIAPTAVRPEAEPVFHLYVVRAPDREGLARALRDAGVETGVHYPTPLHLQPAYRHLGIREGALPNTERAAREILSLPMFPELTDEQIDHVAGVVRAHVELSAR